MVSLTKITKALARLVPGTGAHRAAAKRKYERELRAKGYTWTEVLRLTAAHFRKDG